MTVNPIMIDLSESNQIENYNIESMLPAQCININVSQVGICSWITSKGGSTNIAVFDIMTLVNAYIGQTSLGFTVTSSYIMGGVAYYLGNTPSGNSLTGCSF